MRAPPCATSLPGLLAALPMVAVLVTCSEPSGPAAALRIELDVQPDSVAVGDSVEVTVAVVNPTGRTITVTSMCGGALYWIEAEAVVEDEETVRLDGLDQGCFWVVTDVELPPGPRRNRRKVRLTRPDGSPAPAGRYRVTASPLARELDDDRASVRMVDR